MTREPCRGCYVLFDPFWFIDGLCPTCYYVAARKNDEGWRDAR